MIDGDRIGALLLLWEERLEHGEDVPVEELCRDCPDLLPAVAARIESLRRTGWLKSGARTADTGDGPGVPVSTTATGTLRLVGGRYLLYRLLGEGGFGEVWRAFDLIVERMVAVKLPRKRHAGSVGGGDGFLAEARKAASLDHPGIVPVYDVGTEGGAYYIVSKLIEGTDLERRLRSGPVPLREAVRVVAEVARHLHHAHGKGLVHRDIKPANILIDPHGAVFVTDFGIAASPGEAQALGADAAGTLAYMGPERLAGHGEQADARTDIYSLGVVLYRLLTGRLPFDADTHPDLIDLIVNHPAAPPRSLAPAVPVEVEIVCLKCLEKNPANRPPTAEAVARTLDRWLRRPPLRRRVIRSSLWGVCVCGGLALGVGLSGVRDRNGTATSSGGGAPPAVSEKPPDPLPQFREVRRIEAHPGAVLAVAYSADGRRALSAGADAVRVWELDTGKQLDPVAIADPKGGFQSVAFAPDGRYVITFNRPQETSKPDDDSDGLRLWDTASRKQFRRYSRPTLTSVRLAFSSDGRRLAWAWKRTEHANHKEKTPPGIGVWDVQGWKEVWSMNGLGRITEEAAGFVDPSPRRVVFAPGGKDILCTAIDLPHKNHVIRSVDTTTGEVRMRFKGHTGTVLALACLPDGLRFLSAGEDKVVRIWDAATGKTTASLEGHTDGVTALAVSPSGRRALSASADRTVRLWSLETSEPLHSFTGHKGLVQGLAFAPDGRSALYGAGDGTLRVIEFPPE